MGRNAFNFASRGFGLAVLCLASLTPATSNAEALTPAERENLAQPVRGFYSEFNFGTMIFTGDPGTNNGIGTLTGLGFGYDVHPSFQIGAHFWGATADGGQDVGAGYAFRTPDVHVFLLEAEGRYLHAFSKRMHGALRVGGGLMMGTPKPSRIFEWDPALFETDSEGGDNSPVVSFGGGLEYYTRLRHFSVGAEAGAHLALGVGGLAITLYPVIRYTF